MWAAVRKIASRPASCVEFPRATVSASVALVTAGPGVTNAITGIANAHVARSSVLVISGLPPRAQENRGALQDIVHTDLVRSITRYARTVREPRKVLTEMGLELPEATAVRVWDSSADLRYMVLPERPAGTGHLTEEDLVALVSRDTMIGVANPKSPESGR